MSFQHFFADRMRSAIRQAGVLVFAATAAFAQLQTPSIKPSQHVDVETVTVTPFGVYPKSITRSAGPFLIFVNNQSRIPEETFSLQGKPAASMSSAQSLLNLASTQRRHFDYKLIDPLPGDYQLIFAHHPGWSVSITITAK